MDRFTFVSATAQIRTKSGQTYDYETHELFVVRVTADDGNGGTKTATVVIRVRNVAEPPQAPTNLTLVQAYPTSMALSWTPPDNTGRPAITGYDLQYKKSNETTWTAGLQGITETSDSITGLDPSTSYHVQVRANNDDGNGPWSSTLSRSTPSSSPGISITKTNLTSHRRRPNRTNLPRSPRQPANGRRPRVLLRVRKLHSRTTQASYGIQRLELERTS